MSEANDTLPYQRRRRYGVLLASLSLALILLLAVCLLGAVAVQHRVIAPPSFAFQLGSMEIAAPCPTRVFICPHPMPWYAIWRSDEGPNGSIKFRQLFFVYLEPSQRP
jgi:hypothetical protein